MIKMMISFFKDYFKYRKEIDKHDIWIRKFAEKNNYSLNPNRMVFTNLKIWLTEMKLIFGKRYCPCFEPTGDKEKDRKMMCPCTYLKEEIAKNGACHCALFGKKDLSKTEWKAAENRLMGEYRIKLNYTDGILDTRGMPLDPHRGLPTPDPTHQLKSTLMNLKGSGLTMIVEKEQEMKNLEQVAAFRGFGFSYQKGDEAYQVNLTVRK